MTCASELKPRMHFNEDPCEKIHSYTGELLLVLTIVKMSWEENFVGY